MEATFTLQKALCGFALVHSFEPGRLATPVRLPVPFERAQAIAADLEQGMADNKDGTDALRHALLKMPLLSVRSLLASKLLPVERVHEAAPVYVDLASYHDFLLKGPSTRMDADERVERLEALIHDLGWIDWTHANAGDLAFYLGRVCSSGQMELESIRRLQLQLLQSLEDYLAWLSDFPEVPTALHGKFTELATAAYQLRGTIRRFAQHNAGAA